MTMTKHFWETQTRCQCLGTSFNHVGRKRGEWGARKVEGIERNDFLVDCDYQRIDEKKNREGVEGGFLTRLAKSERLGDLFCKTARRLRKRKILKLSQEILCWRSLPEKGEKGKVTENWTVARRLSIKSACLAEECEGTNIALTKG